MAYNSLPSLLTNQKTHEDSNAILSSIDASELQVVFLYKLRRYIPWN